MKWRRLFNTHMTASRKHLPGEADIVSARDEEAKGVFITPQSLATFPVATAVITILWKVVEALVPAWKGHLWVPALISLLLGAFIFFVAVSDPDSKAKPRDWAIGGVVALLNSCYLFASTTGIISDVIK